MIRMKQSDVYPRGWLNKKKKKNLDVIIYNLVSGMNWLMGK